MSRAWCGRSLLNSSRKSSNLLCCCRLFMPAVLLRMTGLDAFDGDAQTQPPDGELGEVEQGVGRGERNTVVGAHAARQAALLEQPLKGGKSKGFTGRFQGFTEEEKARGVIGDG